MVRWCRAVTRPQCECLLCLLLIYNDADTQARVPSRDPLPNHAAPPLPAPAPFLPSSVATASL